MIRKNHSGKSTGEKASRSSRIAKLGVLIICLWMIASVPAMAAAGGSAPDTSAADRPTESVADADMTTQVETQDAGGENGTVFFGSNDMNVYAIDRGTGNEIWSNSVGDEIDSSPTVFNETLYVGADDGSLNAINASTGSDKWTYPTGDQIADTSPTVVGGTVYFGSDDSNLYAVDESTGNEKWNFSTGGAIDSSPTVVGGTMFVGSDDNNLYAIDAETGEEEWSTNVGDPIDSSPTVAGGSVYVGAGNNLHVVDASTGETEWTHPTGGAVDSSPTVFDTTVYFGANDNHLYAVDANTGNEKWTFEMGDIVLYSSPTVADGTVYVGSHDNSLYALDASSGEEQWSFSTGGVIDSSPTVFDGTLYVGSDDTTLYAIDTTTGEEEWSFSTGAPVESTSPTVVSSGSFQSDGSRVMLRTLGHHSDWNLGAPSESNISGQVTDQDGNVIENANVETGDGTFSTSTDGDGDFSLSVSEGTHTIEISHPGYRTYTEEGVQEGEYMGVIQLEEKRLEIDVAKRMEPNSDRSYPYQVWWWDDDEIRNEVTANAVVASNNTTIATVDDSNFQIIPQDGVNATVDITATYNAPDGETYNATAEVAVAEATVENLPLLPAAWRISALLGNSQIQTILVATFAAIVGTWFATSFAGLGAFQLVMVVGWFGDYVEVGIVMLSLFTALFIGFNLAANIDYTVRR